MRVSSSSPQTDGGLDCCVDVKLQEVAELPLGWEADDWLPSTLLRSAWLLNVISGGGGPIQPGGVPGGGPGGAFNSFSRSFASIRATASIADPNFT